MIGAALAEEEKRRRAAQVLAQLQGMSQQVSGSLMDLDTVTRQQAERDRMQAERDRRFTMDVNEQGRRFRDSELNQQAAIRQERRLGERDTRRDMEADRDFAAREAARTNAEGERFRDAEFSRQAALRAEAEKRRREALERLRPSVEAHAREVLSIDEQTAAELFNGDPLDSMGRKVAREASALGADVSDEEARDLLAVEVERLRRLRAEEDRRGAESKARTDAMDRRYRVTVNRGNDKRKDKALDDALRELSKMREADERALKDLEAQETRLSQALSTLASRGALEGARWGELVGMDTEEIAARLEDIRARKEALDPKRIYGERRRMLLEGVPLADIVAPVPNVDTEEPPPPEKDAMATIPRIGGPPKEAPPAEEPGMVSRAWGAVKGWFGSDEPAAAPMDFGQASTAYRSLTPEEKARVDQLGVQFVQGGMSKQEALVAAMNKVAGRE